jgi:xanthine phosphoribosyltransferase
MNQKSFSEVMERFINIEFEETFDIVVAIANGGIVPAGIINQRLNADFQTIKINLRDSQQKPRFDEPKLLSPVDFEFKNKRILLVDDRIKTGSTIKLAKELLKDAQLIKTFAVNGTADYALFDELCFRFPWIIAVP